MSPQAPLIEVEALGKSFTLHLRGGLVLPVVAGVSFAVRKGECVALGGPSGIGKSSILKAVFGNYAADQGCIWIRDGDRRVDLAVAEPRQVIALRRRVIGYVSQFLRVIPRVSARDVVAAAAREGGADENEAQRTAEGLLRRLNLPERLWSLPPSTFSGGEQQRVNIARGLAGRHAILLLDEPTASLDAQNSAAVVALIQERKRAGAAILGIFHDAPVREALADRIVDISAFAIGGQGKEDATEATAEVAA
ncbi:alpha-D-ribose 1-methylphosphonate 5-triphosphate synthase subunit PhnL [Rhizobiales bacterium GAS113]|nr:alpha-D-ribose 1-methylphosphonate 5-triphosphate synthase subunit PhnL [Rhizobiales bacterium GAS113]SEB96481.1 alpha-D-ribose 1-methylphosphonate 5-triphosphate synthase subunit PhnL [Rhizobiales bacterium GAS188]